ncbi:beta-galactosidase [Enterococcus sp. JM9B]|uniref:beta-galactosidase n=1 Tax=Enterococcus sp. JM9B TaxID=1857216 RepID=UPI0013752A35|nr:beta-galactosidase [Enterococcus sp. JM9B]KAF1301883.1 hypothetical protein BAU16_08345 [Enterococcus sp. JM9B]
MNQYKINIPSEEKKVQPLLKDGNLSANSRYFIKNGQPWVPIMGEFHFSRYPKEEWLDELYKMKSGGIEIVASYVIWIHHEEVEGEWEFSGDKDLKYFIELCQQVGLYFFLRVGPWVHGEVRNGGFPDWLLAKTKALRTNDPDYVKPVSLFFEKVYQQCKGLFFKDGGPIIGIQIENEYGHVGGSNQKEGYEHLTLLFNLLKEIGYDVPFYTGTGWGGAICLKEMIPVFGGYVEAPWAQTTDQLELNENFLIQPDRDDPNIASDHGTGQIAKVINFEEYPFSTAELGGGLQVTHHRRPLVTGDDIYGQAFAKFASGANLLGYYMYHGGTNPDGKKTTLQESKETGYPNDLPIKSYDFQAPLSEFGEFRKSYFLLRNLHFFIKEFENILASAETFFPEDPVNDPADKRLRISVRHNFKINGGFVFISNYQRQQKRDTVKNVEITLQLPNEEIIFPVFDCPSNQMLILPYHLPIMGTIIQSSNAELVGVINNQLIFTHENPEKVVVEFFGEDVSYLVIPKEKTIGLKVIDEKIFSSKASIWNDSQKIYCEYENSEKLVTYFPEKSHTFKAEQVTSNVSNKLIEKTSTYHAYSLNVSYTDKKNTNLFLKIQYSGDRCELWCGNRLLNDQFLIDGEWRVSLKRFNYPKNLVLKIFAPTESVYYDCEVTPDIVQLNQVDIVEVTKKIIDEIY